LAVKQQASLGSPEGKMLGILAIVLVVLWALGFFAFHVTAAFIHVLLIVAVVLVVLHFLRGRGV
jgi:Flp pilus assembly protein TadB